MKPLPSVDSPRPVAGSAMPSIPGTAAPVLPVSAGSYSTANRRASSSCPVQRVYPWLLVGSTLVAATFCMLYISKPVIAASHAMAPADEPRPTPAAALAAGITPAELPLLPDGNHLPGESSAAPPITTADPRRALPSPSSQSPFEETNLRIQHVLTAETPDGGLSRIVLDVPVLYPSRELRWTEAEVAEARELLGQLELHQEKTRQLRDEGGALLEAWNSLIQRSIPAADLRADSPSLPENEAGHAGSPRPAGLDTTEAVQLQSPGQ